MINLRDTKLGESDCRVIQASGEPVSGKVYKNGTEENINDELIISYKNGVKHGEFQISHHANASVEYDITKGVFKDGVIKGEVKRFFPNGDIYSIGNMKCIEFPSTEDGDLIEFYDTGQVVFFRANGTVDYKRQYLDDQELHFIDEEFYENGNIKCRVRYNNYEKEGEYCEFYESGSIELKKEYKDGRIHGMFREYYPNGQIKREGLYRDGYISGRWVSYHENGQEKSNGNYICIRDPEFKLGEFENLPDSNTDEGRKHGKWIYHDIKGNKIAEEMYKQGMKHGVTSLYGSDGTKSVYLYVNGNKSVDVNKAKNIWNKFTGKD